MAVTIKKTINLKKLGINKIKDRDKRLAVKEEIGEFLTDAILEYVSKGQSPVTGNNFKPLKRKKGKQSEYMKLKKKLTGTDKPNMELYGDMLDDLETRINGNNLEVGFFKDSADEKSLLKAENHNKFTARSRKSKVPKRPFIPKKGNFHKDIMNDIQDIIDEAVEDAD